MAVTADDRRVTSGEDCVYSVGYVGMAAANRGASIAEVLRDMRNEIARLESSMRGSRLLSKPGTAFVDRDEMMPTRRSPLDF
jgi:hypothetical protein